MAGGPPAQVTRAAFEPLVGVEDKPPRMGGEVKGRVAGHGEVVAPVEAFDTGAARGSDLDRSVQ